MSIYNYTFKKCKFISENEEPPFWILVNRERNGENMNCFICSQSLDFYSLTPDREGRKHQLIDRNVGDLTQTTKTSKEFKHENKIDTCVAKITNRVIIANRSIAKQHHSNNKTTITRTQQINSPGKCC